MNLTSAKLTAQKFPLTAAVVVFFKCSVQPIFKITLLSWKLPNFSQHGLKSRKFCMIQFCGLKETNFDLLYSASFLYCNLSRE